jgi:hypothetical protein
MEEYSLLFGGLRSGGSFAKMTKLNKEVVELILGDLDEVVGGGKIGEAAHQTSLFKAASDLGQAAVLAPIGELISKYQTALNTADFQTLDLLNAPSQLAASLHRGHVQQRRDLG